jgi:hypothetical protein
MSPLSPLKTASSRRATAKSGLRRFFADAWASFQRQSELQVMLAAGYRPALVPIKAKRNP